MQLAINPGAPIMGLLAAGAQRKMQGFPQCSEGRIIPELRGIITLDLLGNIDSVIDMSRRAKSFRRALRNFGQAMQLSGADGLHGVPVWKKNCSFRKNPFLKRARLS